MTSIHQHVHALTATFFAGQLFAAAAIAYYLDSGSVYHGYLRTP